MTADDIQRVKFVAHFQWFDARSKRVADEIPAVDMDLVDATLQHYFKDGTIVW